MKKCPVCEVELKEVSEAGVFVDVCPSCNGKWLDRGELDKILARMEEISRDWEEEYRRPAGPRPEYGPPPEYYERYERRRRRWDGLYGLFKKGC